ncbi:MAG: hypothetical protein IT423_18270, partial [Pirellulaceae bacterium]|nr:hypothetical protein [Pirellulaceae bacterium]
QPFQVWRRLRRKTPKTQLVNQVQVNNTSLVQWFHIVLEPMYEVVFNVATNTSLTLEAMDSTHRPIPGQRITFTQGGTGRFRAPGIRYLRATGLGSVSNVRGTDQVTYANLDDWQRHERVGFPFQKNEIDPPHYFYSEQGFEAPSLSGVDAAMVRLDIAQMLHLPPPPSGIPDFPVPTWNAPDITKYLDAIRGPFPGQLALIQRCLEKSKDNDLNSLQSQYLEKIETDGITQGNIPNAQPDPSRPSTAMIPVLHTTLLGVSGDNWISTALGFGTVDIPPLAEAAQTLANEDNPDKAASEPGNPQAFYDYMVTNRWELAWSVKVDLAALMQHRPDTVAPVQLTSKQKQTHRPAKRNLRGNAAIRLNWNSPGFAQGYAIAVSRNPNTSSYLNTPRVGNSGGFDAYVALTPNLLDPDTPPDLQRPSFTDLQATIPFSGSATSRYLVAAIDLFGVWSPWRSVNFTINPLPVNKPGILSAELVLNAAAAVGKKVPADLIIEFGWDWDDRTPRSILFDGAFFNIPVPVVNDPWPPAAAVNGLQLVPGGPPAAQVNITFSNVGIPQIASGHPGNVIRLNPGSESAIPSDNNDNTNKQRRYRLKLTGFTCDFAANTKNAYCVYARAIEDVAPARISEPSGPKVAMAFNPLPPPTAPLAVVNWTAMADSTGRARALLKWTSDPSAKGYVVYEASEGQLRTLLNLSPSEPPIGASWVTRATALQNAVAAQPTKSLSAFVRMNMKLIEGGQHEIDLPDSASNIFAYQIAAVSEANVEGQRSPVSFWAVPRRMQPGIPSLLLRKVNSDQVKVIALPGGGVTPAGYRVFRVRKPNLASDLGLMGPAKILENAAGWQAHQEPQLTGGPSIAGSSIIDPGAVPHWFPYSYRIVAIGPQNLSEGQHRGESAASSVQSILIPPDLALTLVTVLKGIQHFIFRFTSNIPLKKTPNGLAKIEIFNLDPDPPVDPTRVLRKSILAVDADQIQQGLPFQLFPPPNANVLATFPRINRQAPNPQGVTTFSVAVRRTGGQKVRIIRVTDPLSRSLEVEFEA